MGVDTIKINLVYFSWWFHLVLSWCAAICLNLALECLKIYIVLSPEPETVASWSGSMWSNYSQASEEVNLSLQVRCFQHTSCQLDAAGTSYQQRKQFGRASWPSQKQGILLSARGSVHHLWVAISRPGTFLPTVCRIDMKATLYSFGTWKLDKETPDSLRLLWGSVSKLETCLNPVRDLKLLAS